MVLRAGQALLGVRHQVGGVVGAVSPPGRSRQVRDDGLDQAGVGDYRDQRRLRALAALASHPNQRARAIAELGEADGLDGERVVGLVYLEGCLEEAMRLWPTTTMLSRETLAETEWGGPTVPATPRTPTTPEPRAG